MNVFWETVDVSISVLTLREALCAHANQDTLYTRMDCHVLVMHSLYDVIGFACACT